MPSAPLLDIKVVYSSSRRDNRGDGRLRARRLAPGYRLLWLGVVNLVVASGLYYGTWWRADAELRIKLIMTTPLPGVDPMVAAQALVPPTPESTLGPVKSPVSKTHGAAPSVEQRKEQAVVLVGTVIGWEALATIAAGGLAACAGALLGAAGGAGWRRGGLILGLVVLSVLAWQLAGGWIRYGRFTPDHLRYSVGVLLVVLALTGLAVARGGKRLTYLAAIALIVSAAGSVVALYIGTQCGAIKPAELPLPFVPFLALVFVIQSLWGWVLLPVAAGMHRRV